MADLSRLDDLRAGCTCPACALTAKRKKRRERRRDRRLAKRRSTLALDGAIPRERDCHVDAPHKPKREPVLNLHDRLAAKKQRLILELPQLRRIASNGWPASNAARDQVAWNRWAIRRIQKALNGHALDIELYRYGAEEWSVNPTKGGYCKDGPRLLARPSHYERVRKRKAKERDYMPDSFYESEAYKEVGYRPPKRFSETASFETGRTRRAHRTGSFQASVGRGAPDDYLDGWEGSGGKHEDAGGFVSRRGGGLSEEDASTVDFLASEGWHVRKAGTTGVPVGTPKHGLAGDFLRARIAEYLYPLSDLQTCVGKTGKKTGQRADRYDHLALFVVAFNPNRESLADMLGCVCRTIDRVHKRGVKVTQLDRIEQGNARIEEKIDTFLERSRVPRPTAQEIARAVVEQFKNAEPTSAEIAQAVEDFIEGALAEAA